MSDKVLIESLSLRYDQPPTDPKGYTFVDLIKRHKSKSDTFELSDVWSRLPKKKYDTVWDLAAQRINELPLHTVSEPDEKSSSAAAATASASTDEASARSAVEYVDAVCTAALEFMSDEQRKAPLSLFQILYKLQHYINTPLTAFDAAAAAAGAVAAPAGKSAVTDAGARASIAACCELWYTQSRVEKSKLTPQLILYLLMRTLTKDCKQTDIKRVYAVRDALLEFDFDDESSDTLKSFLLRCMISPAYLRSTEGRRFLSFQFGLGVSFIDHIQLAIKNQIPNSRPSLLAHYGEVYFRAWRLAEGQTLIKIEQSCIQDLIAAGVHVASSNTAKAVRRVLAVFHGAKKQKGVDDMLNRLYGPILWRSMKVANPQVRHNAVSLFIDAFPLQNPDAPVAESEEQLQKQFDQLQLLLTENEVTVRTIAVTGVCRVLNLYWELIPLASTKAIVAKLSELAFDSSSPLVREAVLDGFATIIDNHLSHPMLKVYLPLLGKLLNDKSERVSVAFVRLLLKVKTTRTIKFWDVTATKQASSGSGVDALLYTLQSTASERVRIGLCQLLLSSYFPYNNTGTEQLRRALSLIRKNTAAAKVFFANVHHFAPVSAICKLIVILYRCLMKCAEQKQRAESGEDAGDDEKDEKHAGSKKGGKKAKAGAGAASDADDAEEDNSGAAPGSLMPAVQNHIDASDQSTVDQILCIMAQLWHTVTIASAKPAVVASAPVAATPAPAAAKSKKKPAAAAAADADADADADDVSASPSAATGAAQLESYFERAFADGGLQQLMQYFASDVSRVAILSMAAKLPPRCSSLDRACIPHLITLSDVSSASEYGPLLECMYSWGRHDAVLEMIEAGLSAGFGVSSLTAPASASAAGKKKKAAAMVSASPVCSPIMAVRYFAYCLENVATRDLLFRERAAAAASAAVSAKSVPPSPAVRTLNTHELCERISSLLSRALGSLQSHLKSSPAAGADSDDDEHDRKSDDGASSSLESVAARQQFWLDAFALQCKYQLHTHVHMSKSFFAAADSKSSSAKSSSTAMGLPELFKQMRDGWAFVAATAFPLAIAAGANAGDVPPTPVQPSKKKAKGGRKANADADSKSGGAAAADAQHQKCAAEFVLRLTKVTTELTTLGVIETSNSAAVDSAAPTLMATAVPLPQLSQCLDLLNTQSRAAISSAFVNDWMPVLYKLAFQLSVRLATNGAPVVGAAAAAAVSSSSASANLDWNSFSAVIRSIVLATSDTASAHASIRDSLTEIIRVYCAMGGASTAAIVLVLSSVVVRRVRSLSAQQPKAHWNEKQLWQSTTDIEAVVLFICTLIARTPATIQALPAAIATIVGASPALAVGEHWAVLQLVTALQLLADAHVKTNAKRRTYFGSLLECVTAIDTAAAASANASAEDAVSTAVASIAASVRESITTDLSNAKSDAAPVASSASAADSKSESKSEAKSKSKPKPKMAPAKAAKSKSPKSKSKPKSKVAAADKENVKVDSNVDRDDDDDGDDGGDAEEAVSTPVKAKPASKNKRKGLTPIKA